MTLLRCPLSGASSIGVSHCPGYAPAPVSAGDIDGSARAYESCAHLSSETDERGFFPACHHPEADWVVTVAAVMREREEVQGVVLTRPAPGLAERTAAAQTAAALALGRARVLMRLSEDSVRRARGIAAFGRSLRGAAAAG